jgi:integrase
MGAFLRGRWWWYNRTIEGHQYRESLKLRKGQETMLSARIAQVDAKITATHFGLPGARSGVKFSEYIKTYKKHKAHKKTFNRDEQRLDYICSVWPDLPLEQYQRSHMDDLEQGLQKAKLKPATVNRYMELARHLFNLAIEDGLLTKNPLANYEPYVEDGTRRALSDDEIKAVFAAVESIKDDKHFKQIRAVARDLMLFALNTGMRLSEILHLRHDQIHGDTLVVPVSATKSRRRGNSKQRYKASALSPEAQEIIARQPANEEGYVFSIWRRSPNIVFYLSKKIRELSGVKDFTFHFLRHTASTLVASNSSLRTAQLVLDHKDIKTTVRYTHPGLDEQRAAITKLGTHIRELVGR